MNTNTQNPPATAGQWKRRGVFVQDTPDTMAGMYRVAAGDGWGEFICAVATKEHADNIVLAVNHHDRLVAALREMVAEARERNRAAGETVFNPAALEIALEALAELEAGR